MENYFSAKELEALHLTTLPSCKRLINIKATKENWTFRARKGKGGGREYNIDDLPTEVRAEILSLQQKNTEVNVQEKREAAMVALLKLQDNQLQKATIREQIVREYLLFKENSGLNDINSEIVNMFRMVEKFPNYLADMLKFKICSRAEFKQMLATPPLLLTELERAVRYLYIQKNAFGGKTYSQHFGVSVERAGRFNVERLIPAIQELHQRLAGVYIECLPYQDFIGRYDRADSLFYLDPPYWNNENDYGKGIFSKADFDELAKLLKGIKGKFIMSINDVPEIRRIFKAFYIREVQTTYTTGLQSGKRAKELLISNINFDTL